MHTTKTCCSAHGHAVPVLVQVQQQAAQGVAGTRSAAQHAYTSKQLSVEEARLQAAATQQASCSHNDSFVSYIQTVLLAFQALERDF